MSEETKTEVPEVELNTESVDIENQESGEAKSEDDGEEIDLLIEVENDEEDDPLLIDKDDDSPPIRSMRDRLKEQNKKLKEAENRIKQAELLAEQKAAEKAERIANERVQAILEEQRKQAEVAAIPPMPDLWSSEIDGDTDLYAKKLSEHLKAKDAHAKREAAQEEQKKQAAAKQQQIVALFVAESEKLEKKVPDLKVRFAAVERAIKPEFRGAMVEALGAERAAKLMAGIGKSPVALSKLEELQNSGNVFGFIAKATEFSMGIQTVARKKSPSADTVIKQRSLGKIDHDAEIERLRKKGGSNSSEVIAYKRRHKLF